MARKVSLPTAYCLFSEAEPSPIFQRCSINVNASGYAILHVHVHIYIGYYMVINTYDLPKYIFCTYIHTYIHTCTHIQCLIIIHKYNTYIHTYIHSKCDLFIYRYTVPLFYPHLRWAKRSLPLERGRRCPRAEPAARRGKTAPLAAPAPPDRSSSAAPSEGNTIQCHAM